MTPEERKKAIQAYIDKLKNKGQTISYEDAAKFIDSEEGKSFLQNLPDPDDTSWDIGKAGKFGVGAKGASVLGDIYSLATANKRQEETVDKYKDLANLSGEATEVDPSAVNLATLNARDDSDARSSTLATLLEQGVDPSAASKIVQSEKGKDTNALLNVLGQYGQQKLTAEERAKQRRMRFDAMATQADLPIDYGQGISSILGKAGDFGLGLESLLNPIPTASARSGKKLKYEGGGKSPDVKDLLDILNRSDRPRAMHDLTKSFSDLGFDSSEDAVSTLSKIKSSMNTTEWRDGGNLQTTQGASDHSENPMMVTNKDGSPAVDEDGNQIEVTGKETIIPDWLMEQLIAAAKKGPKELDKVFKDEIIDEERFQA